MEISETSLFYDMMMADRAYTIFGKINQLSQQRGEDFGEPLTINEIVLFMQENVNVKGALGLYLNGLYGDVAESAKEKFANNEDDATNEFVQQLDHNLAALTDKLHTVYDRHFNTELKVPEELQ